MFLIGYECELVRVAGPPSDRPPLQDLDLRGALPTQRYLSNYKYHCCVSSTFCMESGFKLNLTKISLIFPLSKLTKDCFSKMLYRINNIIILHIFLTQWP